MYKNNYWEETYEKLSSQEEDELRKVDDICNRKNMRWYYNQQMNSIVIITGISSWQIDIREKILLYHKNFRMKNYNAPFEMQYHLQNVEMKNIFHALNYIAKHDKEKYRPRKKTSLELAFEKIRLQKTEEKRGFV